jgi:hypothetical protein
MMMQTQYPQPRDIPPGKVLIGEAGSADVRGNLAKVETLATAKGAVPFMRSLDVMLQWSSPGYEIAGSCCRWTNGYWAVRWQRDGATHGRRYPNGADGEAAAREHFKSLTTPQED